MTRVTLWFEDRDRPQASSRIYPEGMHGAIAAFLRAAGLECHIYTMDGPALTADRLQATDVLIWYGHLHHAEVDDGLVHQVWMRVLQGMGFITFHSGHFAKPFVRLMGTTCQLDYRANPHEREVLWNVCPGHPILAGLGEGFVLEQEEVYREFHDIPAPDELLLLSSFASGEAFRSGCCWQRGAGRVFYFRPGHETCPTWHHPAVQRILSNAVRWAASRERLIFSAGPRRPLDMRPPGETPEPPVISRSHPFHGQLANAPGAS